MWVPVSPCFSLVSPPDPATARVDRPLASRLDHPLPLAPVVNAARAGVFSSHGTLPQDPQDRRRWRRLRRPHQDRNSGRLPHQPPVGAHRVPEPTEEWVNSGCREDRAPAWQGAARRESRGRFFLFCSGHRPFPNQRLPAARHVLPRHAVCEGAHPGVRAVGTAARSSERSPNRPRGIVLVAGATGSGKSTTLAAMMQHINRTSGSTSSP
jgi:hypothetical protein